MATDKLTWADLRAAVAQAAGCSEQEAGRFLTAFIEGITEGLQQDKQVRLKGIGTFALKSVAPRRSVNIATGETFVIDGYNKLVFNAEAALKETVAKRIDAPKTTIKTTDMEQDPIRKLGEQADEIVDILADLGQSPQPAAPSNPPAAEPRPQEPSADAQTDSQTPPPSPRPRRTWSAWVVAAILILALACAGFYFRDTIRLWWQCVQDSRPAGQAVPAAPAIVPDETPQAVPLAQQPREYTRFIGTERVGKGSRLAWISYKYYGVKDLWVFIYEANRDQIAHPNHLKYKQKIRVPLLTEKLMDLSDPETRKLIDDLQQEYLNQ